MEASNSSTSAVKAAASIEVSSTLSPTLEAPATAAAAAATAPAPPYSPLIGVLCIDVAHQLSEIYGSNIKSYIGASYVKYLESAGARVIPIWIARERKYYENIMTKINGILIPGGAVFFNSKDAVPELRNDCVASSKYIYDIAVEQFNATGHTIPIWGTCLGYELFMLHAADGNDLRQECATMDYSLPVVFTERFRESKLFAQLNDRIEQVMRTEPFGYHHHRYCITKDTLVKYNIAQDWHILATNKDQNGMEFISILEHCRYPFFGCQFHPERICYEYLGKSDPCTHSANAIEAVQYLAKFFVATCAQNSNRFSTHEEELRHLIWNHNVTFTGKFGAHWMQCYLFDEHADYVNK